MNWKETKISLDKSYHLINDKPLYKQRFDQVLKFHEPGIAPAKNRESWFHIDLDGNAIYKQKYDRTFGYYFNLAAVVKLEKWFHIDTEGVRVYESSFAWVGNFQDSLCTVRDFEGLYFHINVNGEPIYTEKCLYAGDFRDGLAVIRSKSGQCTHINNKGSRIHDQYYKDLDVFHKGHARARDNNGWLHIDFQGKAIYPHRFNWVENFYNGFALVENQIGEKIIIDEYGNTIHMIKLGEVSES